MLRDHPTLRRALLALVLAWVAVVAYHPHHNVVTGGGDPMPVHSDEYVHWGFASAIATQRTLDIGDPFLASSGGSRGASLHEAGFQTYFAVLHQATGIAWPDIVVFTPVLLSVLTALALYFAGERVGAGIPAALWFAAVPTSLRFLGPGWFVPIAFSLPFLALGLLLLMEEDWGRALVPLALLAAALWTIHVMAAIVLTILALVMAAAWLVRRPARAVGVLAAMALPLLLAHKEVEALVANASYVPTLPLGIDVVRMPGLAFYLAAAVGLFLLASSRASEARRLSVGLGLAALLMGGILVYRASTGIDPFRAYDRATLMLAFLCVLPAGAAVAHAARWLADSARRAQLPRLGAVAIAGLVLLQGVAVAAADRAQMEQVYYVNLPPEKLEAYETAKAQLQPWHKRALVGGGGPTMPFTLITGVPTVWVRTPEADFEPEFVRKFFDDRATDTQLLIQLRVSVVATDGPVDNPDLRKIAEGVYVLRDDYAKRLP